MTGDIVIVIRETFAAEKVMTKLYLAGPLFSMAEQRFNTELARFLEKTALRGLAAAGL